MYSKALKDPFEILLFELIIFAPKTHYHSYFEDKDQSRTKTITSIQGKNH